MSIVGLLAVAALSTAPVVDVPASPRFRRPPDYPSSCLPLAADGAPERVIIVYTVNRDGRAEGLRVRESTNACFNEAVIAAVRSWEFTPRKLDGRSVDQEDVETTLTFTLEAPTQIFDFDARPVLRGPPRYPTKCMRSAADRETVLIEFDVSEMGTTENIRAIDATNKCLVKSAEESVVGWKYEPRIVDGRPVKRKSVQTLITYELSGGPPGVPADRARASVWNALRGVNRYLGAEGDPDKALAALARIEEKYGDSFTRTEQAAFHQLRAGARLDKKDYAGALDDLRIAYRLGAVTEDQTKLRALISELERIVAAQQLAPPASAPMSPPPADPQ
ncbi:MAG: TonB family protein [Parvularculaceae bacterium]|nr:TonB family protein [Parvularculaceae bacterium]